MGTNYYVTYNQCAHCGRGTELHVGKSGTVVRAHPDLGIRSWADWVRYDWVQQTAASGADTWLDDDGYSVTSAEFC